MPAVTYTVFGALQLVMVFWYPPQVAGGPAPGGTTNGAVRAEPRRGGAGAGGGAGGGGRLTRVRRGDG